MGNRRFILETKAPRLSEIVDVPVVVAHSFANPTHHEPTRMTQTRGGVSAAPAAAPSNAAPPLLLLLSERFPVHTVWEFELENGDGGGAESVVVVEGRVHCTDEFSQTVVLKRPLPHTTLAWEVRFVNASAVVRATPKADDTAVEDTNGGGTSVVHNRPLPKVHRRALEERERKALRQAEESFRQINQQVRLGSGREVAWWRQNACQSPFCNAHLLSHSL